jgi:multidrug resistance efflux pump
MSPSSQLDPEAQRVKAHLLKFRPKMAQELHRKGQLDQTAQSLTDQMAQSQASLVQAGMDYNRALEISRPIAYLPDEQDAPELPAPPELNPPPPPTTTE